ncbi:MAG: GAF domain-containing protein [Desulfobacterales bacterium]|nr:GAF domain-containing protein [Desulfobacterales bacterium]
MNLYSIPPLLTLCFFLGLVVLTVVRSLGQRLWTKTNILFLIICIFGSFLNIDILFAFNSQSAEKALLISRIDHVFLVFSGPVFIQFFHAYLNILRRKWLVYLVYAYSIFLLCLVPTPLYIQSMQKHFFGFFASGGKLYLLFGIGGLIIGTYILFILYNAIRNEKSSAKKNRLKYVLAGFGTMGLINGLDVLPILGYSVYPPGNLSFIPLIIFAVGLFKHDLLDMGILIKKSLLYSLITAFLTCIYAFLIIIADKVFKNFNFSDSYYFPILLFLLVAFIFGPLKTKVQTVIDHIFSKGKYDYQKTIKQVSRMITSVLDYDEIAKLLIQTVFKSMRVDRCILFLRDTSGTGFKIYSSKEKPDDLKHSVSGLDKSFIIHFIKEHHQPIIRKHITERKFGKKVSSILSDMDELCAEVLLPMIFKDKLNGFIVLGEKLSGDLFSPEDLDLLETLSSQSALAMENANSYRQLNELNRNLENIVKERTRKLNDALVEKEKTQDQLIRSESLAAIGQLVAGTAHELNNPLTSVSSLIQSTVEDLVQIADKITLDQELIDDLKFALKELSRARDIVASLLGLSRQTQTYTEPVNLNMVVTDALRILYNEYKHYDLEISEDYDPELPDVQGNFANLGQVVLNIIKNAIDAVSENKGSIFLTTRFDKDVHQVVFSCRDTGPGIDILIQKDIFKPFFTTKAVGKGTGLGLYICHEIVKKHGGVLSLEENDSQSTCFVMKLPTGADPFS